MQCCSSEATAAVSIGTTPGLHHAGHRVLPAPFTVRAGEASITANTFVPFRDGALMAEKAMQTLVLVPATISVLRPVAFTACNKNRHYPAWPLRDILRVGRICMDFRNREIIRSLWYGCGSNDRHIACKVAILASAAAKRARNSGIGMSRRRSETGQFWWSISSITASLASMQGVDR